MAYEAAINVDCSYRKKDQLRYWQTSSYFLDLAKPRFLDLANLRFLDYSDTISRLRVISSMLTPKRRATSVACSSVIGFRLAHNHNACVGASGLRDRCSCMCFRKAVKPSRFVAPNAAV